MARSQEQRRMIALVAAPVISAVVAAVVAVAATRIVEHVEERRLLTTDEWNLHAEVEPSERPTPVREGAA